MIKKQLIAAIVLTLLTAQSVHASVTVRYSNKDSQTHKMDVKISGNSKVVEFGGSRTTSLTIQGGDRADIKTSCGKVSLKTGDKIEIKNGCIKIK